MAAKAVAAAPWRPQFVHHLSKLPSPEFVLTTVHWPSSSSPPLPRARYCIMRGFWADLPENKHNEAPQNPAVYSSDLLTFTTDARMEKYEDLSRDGVEKGGDVEAIFWIKDVMRQWRIRGRAYVIGGGEEKEKELRDELEKRMRKTGDGEWSWEKEITAHWGNLSPSMRGSCTITSLTSLHSRASLDSRTLTTTQARSRTHLLACLSRNRSTTQN